MDNQRASHGDRSYGDSRELPRTSPPGSGLVKVSTMGKRVLLVEDEGIVAMVVEDYLLDLGYEVVGVAARLEAGMRLAQYAAIDVAILDVNLAGKLSYPIAELLYERGIPFLFATGYGSAGRPDEFRDIPTLAKPYGKNDLARALLEVCVT
jgi:CheY-like chemotaxis protein